MKPLTLALVTLLLAAANTPASAQLVARIDLSNQQLQLWIDGERAYLWPISTARRGYRTPTGTYHPQRMYRRYFSRKYDDAPMPHAIFFHDGYAIHGTTDVKRLGRPASHGCIRLHPRNAAILYELASAYGRSRTRIIIVK